MSAAPILQSQPGGDGKGLRKIVSENENTQTFFLAISPEMLTTIDIPSTLCAVL